MIAADSDHCFISLTFIFGKSGEPLLAKDIKKDIRRIRLRKLGRDVSFSSKEWGEAPTENGVEAFWS